jgi:hypothetical protein
MDADDLCQLDLRQSTRYPKVPNRLFVLHSI